MILRQSPSGPITRGAAPGDALIWNGSQWLPSAAFTASGWQFFPAAGVDLPYATVNADGFLVDGVFQGAFRTVGKSLELLYWFAVGAATVLGTGPAILPLPPGLAPDPAASPSFFTTGVGVWPSTAAGQIGGSFFGPASPTVAIFGFVLNDFNEIPALAAGDQLLIATQIQIQ